MRTCLIFCFLVWIFLPLAAFPDFSPPSDSTDRDEKKKLSFLELPIITYSPETSLRLGAVSLLYFRFKNSPEGTHLSTVRVPITYTLENQIKVRGSYTLFFPENRHYLDGYIQWLRFPLFFYGIGSDTREEGEEVFTTRSFEIEFNYLARILGDYYLGFRYNREDSKTVEFEDDGLLAREDQIPGAQGAVTSGLGLLARLDRRDNVMCPAAGPYLEVLYSVHDKALGSEYRFNKFRMDFRHYFPVFQKRHLLAVQGLFERNWGDPTFERMALLGGDEMMRGHYLGRFRDKGLAAVQVEYRFPLFRDSWVDTRKKIPFWERWGLVAFAGLGNVASDTSEFLSGNLKTSLGFGLRFLAKPEERINIRLDFGFGTQTPGFYFNIREAF